MTHTRTGVQSIGPVRNRSGKASYLVFVATLSFCLIAALVTLAGLQDLPSAELVLILCTLVIVTENRDRLFGDETSISSSMVVAIASIIAFRSSSPLLAPTICAACAGIYWPHLRERSYAKAVFNASAIGLSALTGAGVFQLVTPAGRLGVLELGAAMVPTLCMYWLTNTILLAGAMSLLREAKFLQTVRLLVASETPLLGFAVAGGFCGYGMSEWNTWGGVAALVLCLAVIDACMISSRRGSFIWSRARAALMALGPPGLTFLSGIGSATSGAVMALVWLAVGVPVFSIGFALVRVHRRVGRWDLRLAWGVAVLELPKLVAWAAVGVVAELVGAWAGLAAAAVLIAVMLVSARWLRSRELRAQADDERVAAAAERAVVEGRGVPSSVL